MLTLSNTHVTAALFSIPALSRTFNFSGEQRAGNWEIKPQPQINKKRGSREASNICTSFDGYATLKCRSPALHYMPHAPVLLTTKIVPNYLFSGKSSKYSSNASKQGHDFFV